MGLSGCNSEGVLLNALPSVLRKLNLPSSLEALERPVGLPPSLLRKAEEVRLEEGPVKIQASIEDVERLACHDIAILEEVSFNSPRGFGSFPPNASHRGS